MRLKGLQVYLIPLSPVGVKYINPLSWEVHRGEITGGLWVLHRCDVRACVNPDHLFLGTPRDNVLDCMAKNKFLGGLRGITHGSFCRRNHVVSGPNAYVRPTGRIECRECRRMDRPGADIRDAKSVRLAEYSRRADVYPKLVAALELAFAKLTDKGAKEEIGALLRELGEDQ